MGFSGPEVTPTYTTQFLLDVTQKLALEYCKHMWSSVQRLAADSDLLCHSPIISILREDPSGPILTQSLGLHMAPFMLLGTGTSDLLHCPFCKNREPGNVMFEEFDGQNISMSCRICKAKTPIQAKTCFPFLRCSEKNRRSNLYVFDYPLTTTQKAALSVLMVRSTS